MDKEFLDSVRKLNFADLNNEQTTRLRELEEKFNEEFSTELYLMAMEKNTK